MPRLPTTLDLWRRIAPVWHANHENKEDQALQEHTFTTWLPKRQPEHICECHPIHLKKPSKSRSLTVHNVHYLLDLMARARQAILDDEFPAFLRIFFAKLYGEKSKIPSWILDALRGVGVDLSQD